MKPLPQGSLWIPLRGIWVGGSRVRMESSVRWVLGATLLLFGTGAAVISIGQLQDGSPDRSKELWRLYISELKITSFILVPTLVGGPVFLSMIAILALRVQHELFEALTADRPLPGGSRLQGASTLLVLAATQLWGPGGLLGALLGVSYLILVVDLFHPVSGLRVEDVARGLFTLLYPVSFVAFLLLLRDRPDGALMVSFLFGVVEVNDCFALIFGKLFGKKKVFPTITPGKTYLGLLAGIAFAASAAILFGLVVMDRSPCFLVLCTIVTLFTGILGDLVPSKIKRNLGLKDFGDGATLQGGMLDLYDSLIFSAPVFYLFVTLFPG